MFAVVIIAIAASSQSAVGLLFAASISYNSHYSDPVHFLQIFFIGKTHSEIFLEDLKSVLAQFGV